MKVKATPNMANEMLGPNSVLEALKVNASARTQRSLEILHQICEDQYKGSTDFSIATIGRLSTKAGGPATQSIRNKEGAKYRDLLAAWSTYSEGGKKNATFVSKRSMDGDLLGLIGDASARALVGVILAENKKLKSENGLLKNQTQVLIDKRSLPVSANKDARVEVLPALGLLLPAEISALKDSISLETLARMGWQIDDKTGRVTKEGRGVFKAGFATAIRKVLDS